MHPRRIGVRARGLGGPGGVVASRVPHEGGREARAHGSMAGLSVLHKRKQAKAPKRRAASEERQRDVPGHSPSRLGSQSGGRRGQASELGMVENGGQGIGGHSHAKANSREWEASNRGEGRAGRLDAASRGGHCHS